MYYPDHADSPAFEWGRAGKRPRIFTSWVLPGCYLIFSSTRKSDCEKLVSGYPGHSWKRKLGVTFLGGLNYLKF